MNVVCSDIVAITVLRHYRLGDYSLYLMGRASLDARCSLNDTILTKARKARSRPRVDFNLALEKRLQMSGKRSLGQEFLPPNSIIAERDVGTRCQQGSQIRRDKLTRITQ
jgi:hypothetical protein